MLKSLYSNSLSEFSRVKMWCSGVSMLAARTQVRWFALPLRFSFFLDYPMR